MLQQTYSIFWAIGQQVVPATIIKKKNQLVSYAPADLLNIFSKRAKGCLDDYYIKKEEPVSELCSSRLIQYFQQAGNRLSRWLLYKKRRTS